MTAPTPPPARRAVFSPGSWPEALRLGDVLRRETVGGILLLVGAVTALVWANSPWADGYRAFGALVLGPSALHLDLSVSAWAADGLLAVFFFVAGLELKREFVAGDLRSPARAVVPVVAAVGGMAVPAVLYLAVAGGTAPTGWAVPTATDIAFALAVLAVIATHLPVALRTFLLTLAVVDDLLAICVIALLYTADLNLPMLGLAFVPLAAFGVLVQRGISSGWLLLPLAVATWALVHASGVHATVAGVLLAFTVPVRSRRPAATGMAERFEHRLRPVSAAVAVPLFALLSAGVAIGGWSGFTAALSDPVAVGVVVGLVVGKPIGILAGTFLAARVTRQPLQTGLVWPDLVGVGLLGGIGFTVSLLIGELAFADPAANAHVTIAVLTGSVVAAALAAVLLRLRNRRYRRMCDEETRDDDHDGVPDVYQ